MANYSTPEVYNFSDGNGGWGNGWGGIIPGFLGGIFGGALFGNGFGGWGGNNNGSAAAALGAQATANNNTDLMMNSIGNLGTQVAGINTALNQQAVQNAVTPLQVTNSIQNLQNAMQSQFSNCCCENRLQMCEQTNTLQNAIQQQTIAMNEQFCALQQRELQAEINAKNEVISQLRDQAQTNAIQGSIAILQQQINALAERIPVTTTTTTPASNG